MGDVLTPQQRKFCMSRIRGRDTKPEITLRVALWRFGLRYRLRSKLLGKPDLVFARHRTVLFIDGCFWHGCPRHMVNPKTNRSFWLRKIRQNIIRDLKVNRELRTHGWFVIRVWEHDIRGDKQRLAERIHKRITRQPRVP